jgi:hypothetical protein
MIDLENVGVMDEKASLFQARKIKQSHIDITGIIGILTEADIVRLPTWSSRLIRYYPSSRMANNTAPGNALVANDDRSSCNVILSDSNHVELYS